MTAFTNTAMFRRLILALPFWLAVTAAASAQPNLKKLPRVDLKGAVVKVRAGYIELTAESITLPGNKDESLQAIVEKTTKYVVAVHPKNTKVRVSGTTEGKFLKSGQYVRFKGRANREYQIAVAVASLEVFVPEKSFQPKAELQVPPPSFIKDRPTPTVLPIEVAGRVISNRKDKLVLLVDGGRQLTVPLDPKATVRFTMARYSTVKRGDPITVSGRLYRPGQVIGESIAITPLSDSDKKETLTPASSSDDFNP